MAPSTPKNQRKRLSNAEKQEIIEDSLKLGFCRKKTWKSLEEDAMFSVTYSSHLLNLLTCPIVFLD